MLESESLDRACGFWSREIDDAGFVAIRRMPPKPIAAAPIAKAELPAGAKVAAVPVVPQSVAAANTASLSARADEDSVIRGRVY